MNHVGTQQLETSRLILRKFRIKDAPIMFQNWANDPEVTRYVTWLPHGKVSVTQSLLEEWTARYSEPDTYHWCIVDKNRKEAIGDISVVRISERDSCCEIGYCLSRQFWGQGIMTEAYSAVLKFLFETVGFHRVEAKHVDENPASGKVMKKCGMLFEGISRKAIHLLSDQSYHDLENYAILLEDWTAK